MAAMSWPDKEDVTSVERRLIHNLEIDQIGGCNGDSGNVLILEWRDGFALILLFPFSVIIFWR